jgi:2-polyprenyl-6-methoxyphenol hydroxylase-like FAD-dependent oxidoreductase
VSQFSFFFVSPLASPFEESFTMSTDYDVIIIGGGIVGMACAVALSRKGVKRIKIYEKALSLQPVGAAIGLFPNGLAALEAISSDVCQKVKSSSVANMKMEMRNLEGTLLRSADVTKSSNVTPTYLVWYLLQEALRDDLPEGVLNLGHGLKSFQVLEDGTVRVSACDRANEAIETKTCRVLLGADGINSTVRSQLFQDERQLYYQGKMMFRSVMNMNELNPNVCPPGGTSVAYQGDESGKLFAFRETAKGIATFTAMAVFEKPDLIQNDDLARKERLQKLFANYPADVAHIIDRMSPSALYENAVHDILVEEQWSKGPVLLLGDAAHAMTPGLGQGANQGLEDACELAHLLAPRLLGENEASENTISDVLETFWCGRIDRVKEVHAASREQTQNVNKSNSKSAVDFRKGIDQAFMDRLYQWKPTSISAELR